MWKVQSLDVEAHETPLTYRHQNLSLKSFLSLYFVPMGILSSACWVFSCLTANDCANERALNCVSQDSEPYIYDISVRLLLILLLLLSVAVSGVKM